MHVSLWPVPLDLSRAPRLLPQQYVLHHVHLFWKITSVSLLCTAASSYYEYCFSWVQDRSPRPTLPTASASEL